MFPGRLDFLYFMYEFVWTFLNYYYYFLDLSVFLKVRTSKGSFWSKINFLKKRSYKTESMSKFAKNVKNWSTLLPSMCE